MDLSDLSERESLACFWKKFQKEVEEVKIKTKEKEEGIKQA